MDVAEFDRERAGDLVVVLERAAAVRVVLVVDGDRHDEARLPREDDEVEDRAEQVEGPADDPVNERGLDLGRAVLGLGREAGEGAENAASQATAIFKAFHRNLDQVRGLVFVGQRRWNIILKSGQVIMLPENQPEQAIQKILILDKAERILARQIAVFDFRLPSRVTLRVPSDKYGQINSKAIGVRN